MQNVLKTLMSGLKTFIDKKIRAHRSDWSQNDSTAPDYIKNRPFWSNDTEIHQLDEKYIPDSVARVGYVDEIKEETLDEARSIAGTHSDWNEHNPYSLSYIENRTHYEAYMPDPDGRMSRVSYGANLHYSTIGKPKRIKLHVGFTYALYYYLEQCKLSVSYNSQSNKQSVIDSVVYDSEGYLTIEFSGAVSIFFISIRLRISPNPSPTAAEYCDVTLLGGPGVPGPSDGYSSFDVEVPELKFLIKPLDEKYIPDTIVRSKDLEGAVSTALTQAKESGEFNGADYVLTDTDKQDIAQLVLTMLPQSEDVEDV